MLSVARVVGMRYEKRILYCLLLYRLITFHYVKRPIAVNLNEPDRLSCKWNIEPCRSQIPLEDQQLALQLLARDLLSVQKDDPYAPDLALACLLFRGTVPYGPEGPGGPWMCVACSSSTRGCPQNHNRGHNWDEVCAFYCPRPERPIAAPRNGSTDQNSTALTASDSTTSRVLNSTQRMTTSPPLIASDVDITSTSFTESPQLPTGKTTNTTTLSTESVDRHVPSEEPITNDSQSSIPSIEIRFTLWMAVIPGAIVAFGLLVAVAFFVYLKSCSRKKHSNSNDRKKSSNNHSLKEIVLKNGTDPDTRPFNVSQDFEGKRLKHEMRPDNTHGSINPEDKESLRNNSNCSSPLISKKITSGGFRDDSSIIESSYSDNHSDIVIHIKIK